MLEIYGIHLDKADIWILGIAGSLISIWIGYRLARSGARSDRYFAACREFRHSVLDILSGLYPVPTNWPKDSVQIDNILRDAFPKLQSAITSFRSYIPWYKRWAFDRAWKHFYSGKEGGEIDGQNYWQYIPTSGESVVNGKRTIHDNTMTYKDNFKRNIDRLFKYASNT